jgi:hypothetical protein
MDNLVGIDSLFSTPVANIQLLELVDPVEKLLSSYNYKDFSGNCTISHDVLTDKLKKAFTKEVQQFLQEYMHMGCEIQMTTSWFTRIWDGQFLNPHRHCNSWWSCCFYFEEDCRIQLNDRTYQQMFVIPEKQTLLNAKEVTFEPNVGTLLVFPSGVEHQILPHNDKERVRFSLAFNFIPKGKVGYGDSSWVY